MCIHCLARIMMMAMITFIIMMMTWWSQESWRPGMCIHCPPMPDQPQGAWGLAWKIDCAPFQFYISTCFFFCVQNQIQIQFYIYMFLLLCKKSYTNTILHLHVSPYECPLLLKTTNENTITTTHLSNSTSTCFSFGVHTSQAAFA